METTTSKAVAVRELDAGDQLGPYRLLRLIGQGATGRVFEVEHTVIGRRAALKVLAADHALRPSTMRRLFAEAQAVNRINHPHIVEITDIIEPDGPGARAGVVMELLEGQSLAQLIEGGQPLELGRMHAMLVQVADALAAAHAAGFIHRDLKPENLFVTERDGVRDYVKLLDFGLAKSLIVPEGTSPDPNRTVEGTFLGTAAYTSPEQASGKPVDHRTDIYAFGVILYQLLCGRLPFTGDNLGAYLVQHMTVSPPPVPQSVLASPLGAALADVTLRCLEKEPADRYGTAGELKQALLALPAAPAAATTRHPWWRGKAWWWQRPHRVRIAIGLAAATVAIGLAIVVGRAITPASHESQATPAPSHEPRTLGAPAEVPAPPVSPAADPDPGPEPELDRTPRKPRPPARRASRQRSDPMRERTLDPWRR